MELTLLIFYHKYASIKRQKKKAQHRGAMTKRTGPLEGTTYLHEPLSSSSCV